jgi:hypothetical protein
MKKIVLGVLASTVLLGLQASGNDGDAVGKSFDPNRLLRGDYAFVSTQNCVMSPAGFAAPPLFTPLGPTTSQSTTTGGVVTFNGDGTGSVTGRSTSIVTNVITSTPTFSSVSCAVNYQVGSRGAYRAVQNCSGTSLSGTAAGTAFTVSPMRSTGFLRNDLLLTASDGLVLEIVSSGGVSTPRLCHRSTSTSKIGLLPR